MGTGCSQPAAGLTIEQVIAMIQEYMVSRNMDVRDAFLFVDQDQSGFISFDEFLIAFQACLSGSGYQFTTDDVWQVFSKCDVNGDGRIDIQEFCALYCPANSFGTWSDDAQYWASTNSYNVAQYTAMRDPMRLGEEVIARVASAIVRTGRTPHEVFLKVDVDQNGTLSRDEIERMVRTFQSDVSPSEMAAIWMVFDRDNNGCVDMSEFVKALQSSRPEALLALETKVGQIGSRFQQNGYNLLQAFSLFDRDNDSFLTRDEWQRALGLLCVGLNPEDCEAVFRRFDANGDGFLSIDEFSCFFNMALQRHTSVGPDGLSYGVDPSLVCAQTIIPEQPWEAEALNLVRDALSVERSGLRIDDVFRRLDLTQTGTMSSYEFNRMMSSYRPDLQTEHLNRLFQIVNVSGNGSINLSEFVRRFG
eukprot:gnl/TRDRNA2_/TRDRNA2_165139_c0_seq1.p1 gnl/TRDRNA2_/TRDRNA2_165139_c0~~gnl/TRDRNA2_/TRDRNA2_165139_c0_seq1.p1  ORF type:complete len:418 (+),score=46.43 gnl/TRDRNA2_/TRDRNA2_165139_c0_seq1:58-1311(+)